LLRTQRGDQAGGGKRGRLGGIIASRKSAEQKITGVKKTGGENTTKRVVPKVEKRGPMSQDRN